ncbi:MAG: transposase [Planctomycetota bacterium]
MLLDGHSAASVAERLGLSCPNLLYRWKRQLIGEAGKTAESLDGRVRELEAELRRVQQERDILKRRWPFSAERSDRRVCSHRSDRDRRCGACGACLRSS